nr:hypothetical protein [Verrucomicrobiota bacterium]
AHHVDDFAGERLARVSSERLFAVVLILRDRERRRASATVKPATTTDFSSMECLVDLNMTNVASLVWPRRIQRLKGDYCAASINSANWAKK